MKKEICYIFGAGEYFGAPPVPKQEDFVIAADGGYCYLKENKIGVNLMVGDFDSLKTPLGDVDAVVLPQEKDDTDMVASIREGLSRGYRLFHIYGGTGGRLDHTLANIQCVVELAQSGARGFLFDKDTVITAIHNSSISFPAEAKGMISVFSHTDMAAGVFEKGLKYPLKNATLSNIYPLGISNEFTGVPSSISVCLGTLVLIYSKNIEEESKGI